MSFEEVILKNVKYNIKNYVSYIIGTSIALSILFMFFNFFYSQTFIEKSSEIFKEFEKNAIISVVIIFFILFIAYITVTFIKSRGKELGVYYTIGLTSKEILRILLFENVVVCGISAIVSILFGMVFSKLFNLAFLKVMIMDNINIGINKNGFLIVLVIAISIIIINYLYQKILLKKNSIIEMIKFSAKKEVMGNKNIIKGFLAIILLVISIVKINKIMDSPNNNDPKNLLFVVVAILSVYFIIGFSMNIVIILLKPFPKIYNNNLITIKSLSSKFISYRSTLFICLLMACSGLFTITEGSNFYKLAGSWIDDEYRSDLGFVVNKKQLDENDFRSIIGSNAGEVIEYNELENIEENYLEANNKEGGYNVKAVRIISNSTYNKNTDEKVFIKENQVIVPSANKNDKYINIPSNSNLILKIINDGKAINKDYNIDYCRDLDKYKSKNSKNKFLEYENRNIIYKKMKLSNMIYENSSDMRPEFIVVNDNIYDEMKRELSPENIYYDILANLKDDSNYSQINEKLKEQLNNIGGESLKETLSVKSNLRHIERTKNSFVFFTFMFLGAMSLIGCGGILYFKIFTSFEEDRNRKMSFIRIGLTSKEIKRIISKEIRIIFYVPAIIALLIVLFIILKQCNYMSIENANVIKNVIMYTFIGYSVIYSIICEVSKRIYIKRLFALK